MPLNPDLFNYNQGKQDYILARLIVTKKYIKENNIADALECLEDVIKDIKTDYGSELK